MYVLDLDLRSYTYVYTRMRIRMPRAMTHAPPRAPAPTGKRKIPDWEFAAIKEIQNLIKEDSPKLEEYGHIESTVEFYQALWVCSSMFSKAS